MSFKNRPRTKGKTSTERTPTPASQHVVDVKTSGVRVPTTAQQYPNEKLAAAVLDVMRAAAAADEVDGSVKR